MKNIKYKIYKKIVMFSLTSMLFSLTGCKENNDDNTIGISFEETNTSNEDDSSYTKYELLDSTSELKQYFNGDVSFDIVRQSLENNPNITDEYKIYTHEFIDLVEKRYPNIDLTIFNENIKTFKVNEISIEEMKKDKNREAYYEITCELIAMHDEHENEENKKYCYFHELWHMFNNLHLEENNIIYYKTPTMFDSSRTAFDEGMNTFLTEQIYECGITSYMKQYDQIKILYAIYGDKLIEIYLDTGIEGVEFFLADEIGYRKAFELIDLMNDELNKENETPIKIYEILFELYFSNKNGFDHEKVINILENLNYNSDMKKQILKLFSDLLPSAPIQENWLVTFNEEKYYSLNDLYFIECNGNEYLVNDEVIVEFFNTGFIRNIYDSVGNYEKGSKIKLRSTLLEYLSYNIELFTYDENICTIYINSKVIMGDSYVKNK